MICKYVWIGGFLVSDISIFTTNTYRVLVYRYLNGIEDILSKQNFIKSFKL